MRNEKEIRKQKRLEKLGSNYPVCVNCGESDDRCLEEHHIAGRAHGDELAILCRNCHRKVSDNQKDHPVPASEKNRKQSIGYLLIGQADLFQDMEKTLRQHGEYLIQSAMEKVK